MPDCKPDLDRTLRHGAAPPPVSVLMKLTPALQIYFYCRCLQFYIINSNKSLNMIKLLVYMYNIVYITILNCLTT